ncbi:uncharacterized protein LOC112557889 isoform X2 [Pomacea canaliculata]|nr:uncharacterized protein LOC112557889 isoform X2 [Pomacea canaliculata]
MATPVFQFAAIGVLALAFVIHSVCFSTDNWVCADLDSRGMQDVLDANSFEEDPSGLGDGVLANIGLSIRLGLWQYCLSESLTGATKCDPLSSNDAPGWMKAVQALGILAMIIAVMGLFLITYGLAGHSKGDRARLLPYYCSCVCASAGLMLLIAVAIFGLEYQNLIEDQLKKGDPMPDLDSLMKNVKDNTKLGWSYILEAFSAFLIIVASLMVCLPATLTSGGSFYLAGRNLAV